MSITSPTLSGEVARQCAAVVAAAPDRVAGQASREITPASRFAAAWGDPAIILTCSGTAPAALTRSSQCYRVNAVDWLVTQRGRQVDPSLPLTGTVEFTTIGRSAYVEVQVPDAYQPAANPLVDLSRAVKGATTATKPCVGLGGLR